MPPRPDFSVYRAPNARSFPADSWTPDLIRQAEIAADSGQLRWAAELCDALLGDDRVQGAREKLASLFGMPLLFDDGVGRMRKRAKRAIEAEEDWWAAFADESLSELLFWGVLLGVALGELVWTERRGRLIPKLRVWHARALRWDIFAERWIVRLGDGSDVLIEPGDGKWVIFSPRAERAPWQQGVWRSVARWWRLKRYAMFDWGRHCEQASGMKVASTETGTDLDRQQLAADLMSSGTDAATVLPPGWKLSQLALSANTKEVFEGLIEAANTAISIGFLGQNLTSEVSEGSFAAASVHQAVSQEILRALSASLSSCLRDQVLVPWARFNFGTDDAAPWPVWQVEPQDGLASVAQSWQQLAQALTSFRQAGVNVDMAAVAETFDLPLLPEPLPAPAAPPLPAVPGRDPLPENLSAAGATPVSQLRAAVSGQMYVDAVFDAAMARAPVALEAGILGALRDAIRDATSYEDLRARLPKILRATDDAAMQELILGAVMCCASAGAFSATRNDA